MGDGITPALRFPEFRGAPPWQVKRLGEVVEFAKGKGIAKADVTENGKTPCIRYGEIYTVYREHITDVQSRTNLDPKQLVLSQARDVIIPASGEDPLDMARACCVESSGIALGGDINILRGAPDGVFLAYFLNSAGRKEIARYAQGYSVVHLYASHLRNLKIPLPSLAEQREIVGCLSSLDDLIEAREGQVSALKLHKRGLMQRLFPAPGEATPALRFPEFRDAPPWQVKRLGEVASVATGASNREDSEEEGDYAFFDRSNDRRRSSRFIFDCEAIIVAGEGKEFSPRYFCGKFDLHQRAYAITEFGENSGLFLYFWIERNRHHFLRFSVGSTVPSLRMATFTSFPLLL
ncbi:MAG: restriction endonuclease subunit S, partial [Hyphomonadaceae bacterium]|nr:restriction endonuclease subunit S [Hyphomonadaceae bacterium]